MSEGREATHDFDLVPDTDHCRTCGHGRRAPWHAGRETTLCRHCGRPITKEATPVKSPYWWHPHSGNVRCDGPSAEPTDD